MRNDAQSPFKQTDKVRDHRTRRPISVPCLQKIALRLQSALARHTVERPSGEILFDTPPSPAVTEFAVRLQAIVSETRMIVGGAARQRSVFPIGSAHARPEREHDYAPVLHIFSHPVAHLAKQCGTGIVDRRTVQPERL